MSTPHRALLVALVWVVMAGRTVAADKAAGAPRPASEFTMAEYAGKVVVVDFWASWCLPCRQALPWLNAMQRTYGPDGLQVVMINLDKKPAAAAKMEAEIGSGIVQFRDPEGKLAEVYELQGMPSTYIYDRRGELVTSHVGFLRGDTTERENELREIVGEGGE